MNTNSDRHLAQLFFEQKLSCGSAQEFADNKQAFEALQLGFQDADELSEALSGDAEAYLRKGIISLLLGLNALDTANETWAFIKLYYSFFFFEKRRLCKDRIALVNCKGTAYSIPAEPGAVPHRHAGKAYSNDHRAAASVFIQRYKDSNVLLSQLIDGEETPRWLFARRNWLNYQRREFIDGTGDWALTSGAMTYSEQVALYCDDHTPIYCFLPEYASLALPLKFAMQAILDEGGPETIQDYIDANEAAGTPSVSALKNALQ